MLYQDNTLQEMFVYFSNMLNKASISNSSHEIIWYLEKLKLINKETMYIKNFTIEESTNGEWDDPHTDNFHNKIIAETIYHEIFPK